eukprot:TRINITY_DN1765_c0_g1_i1.p1 TRINITY_DN1765_c0_g1~~TRINITY_DN1765_c0_g1_i1.p1  ORF type:complete len:178 (+),score=34.41 TRINITY_DN1765_c0_g1_i1:126-659(+)
MGRTSVEWWNQTKADPSDLTRWLQNQYHGEAKAADRLKLFAETFRGEMTEKQFLTVSIIANQESNHAEWVAELLRTRNLEPRVLEKKERYWDKTLTDVHTFIRGAAVAAHAEEMRLERIRAIVADETAPTDIREVFRKILPQEEFHARAFRKMTTDEEYNHTEDAHHKGRIALGLMP